MWADRLALALRPRPMLEAADLGVRMVQQQAGSLGRAYLPAALIVALLAASTWWIDALAPAVALFFLKPWLDRAALLVFSRAAFGQATAVRDAWQSQVLLSPAGLFSALTAARLSPWRAYTQPVAQLEGQRGGAARQRRRLLLRGKRGVAMLQQAMFSQIELLLTVALMSLVYWLTPFDASGNSSGPPGFMRHDDAWGYLFAGCQVMVAMLVEPFFVASGFSMYLNRRVELEAWDVEQELRRAFAA